MKFKSTPLNSLISSITFFIIINQQQHLHAQETITENQIDASKIKPDDSKLLKKVTLEPTKSL